MNILTFVFGVLIAILPAEGLNITIDNTSPLVVFSPTPCFQADVPACNPEWQLSESTDAFNGSTTSTTGPDEALGLTVVPRVSLVFQGSSIVFVPGQHSTAQATVVVDNLSSILVNTSLDAFSGTSLDPTANHTITVTFVPGNNGLTSLDVDYFVIEQLDSNFTSSVTSATSTLIPTLLPTSLPPTSAPALAPTSSPPPTTGTQAALATRPSGTPSGTIAAVSVSGAILVIFAALTWFFAARRRRRRTAYQREKAILYDLRLPSERNSKERHPSVRHWHDEQREQRERELETDLLEGQDMQRREKGKQRERSWRESVLPPVHYTPWR